MIRKWTIPNKDSELSIPGNSYVIHVGEQNGQVVIWTNDHNKFYGRPASDTIKLKIYGTGMEPPYFAEHLGTVQMVSGFVWHVFKVR